MDKKIYILNRILGEETSLFTDETKIRVCHGKRQHEIEFPKTFCNFNYLNHPEEMAGWLQAVLEEKHIRIRRCRFVLDCRQAYLQQIRLPDLSPETREKWIRWESSRYVPFEPGTYRAALLPWEEGTGEGTPEISWQEGEETGEKLFLLAALPRETVDALTQWADMLQARLTAVTVKEPGGTELPVNLLPGVEWKQKTVIWGYKGLTAICVAASLVLSAHSAFGWYRQRQALQEISRQLVPYAAVKKEYGEEVQLDRRIREYSKALQTIAEKSVAWVPVLSAVAESLPEDCWLEEIRGKQDGTPEIEIRGCAADLSRSRQFADRLNDSNGFSRARIGESREKNLSQTSRNGDGGAVTSFVLKAGLVPEGKGDAR